MALSRKDWNLPNLLGATMIISKGFLIQIEVKIIGKNARRLDRPSVIIKPKSEDKICLHINRKLRSKSM